MNRMYNFPSFYVYLFTLFVRFDSLYKKLQSYEWSYQAYSKLKISHASPAIEAVSFKVTLFVF